MDSLTDRTNEPCANAEVQLPCLLFFLLGLCIWLNFQQDGADTMFLYWPVILIGLSVLILFFPGPILYHKSRGWWAYSNVSNLVTLPSR